MKNNFILLTIFIVGLISLVSAFESQEYSLNTSVSQSGINFSVDNSIGVNVTNNSNNGGTTGDTDDDTPASGGGGGGGGGSSLLSSVIKTVYNDSKNETENSNSHEDENSKETTTSTSFINAAVIGVSDFAKSPAGIATFVIVGLFVVGGVTFLAIKGKLKNFLPKKKVAAENNNS